VDDQSASSLTPTQQTEHLIAEALASGATRLELRGLAITHLPPSLAYLAGQLRELDLIGCTELIDIELVGALTALESLAIRRDPDDWYTASKVPDISALSALAQLTSLDLSGCPSLTNVSVLQGLTGLQTLDLSWCDALTDVSVLQGLTGLQTLDLSGCGALTEVSGLQGLTGLQTLGLSGCGALTDVSVLQGLTGLQSLDLSWCDALTDVSVLQGLTGLQTLLLDECSALTDVSVLQGMTGLQHLNLSWCGALTDVSVLQGLTSLQSLYVFDGPSVKAEQCVDLDGPFDFPALNDLRANRIIGAPSELASTDEHDNCLPRLQAWRNELLRGRADHSELKLFVLGNGQVGKTQICRRLRGLDFDASVPSTHGIQLGEHRLELPAVNEGDTGGPVTLRYWDFGGQDIYLGTHALFLDDRAIYLIVWSPEFENTDEVVDNGVVMRNRPLAYWLAYVHSLAGPQARVLVVQTRCDRAKDRREAPLPANHGFETLVQTSCSSNSAVNPGGMKRLLAELEDAARAQIETYGRIPMPQSWADAGESLCALRDEQGRRTIPRDEFDTLCREQHGVTAPGVVLDYLHRGGQVFWNQGAFGGEVVLQLDWALDGLYAVLHRDRLLPILRQQHGLFTPALLAATVWQGKPQEEQDLLLSMMVKCHIAFKAGEEHYIAPAALPEEGEVAQRIEREWRGATANASATLHYAFLHEGVLREMLCALGARAGHDAIYWRHGLCFYDTEAQSTLRIRSEQPDAQRQGGWIEVETAGGDAGKLVATIVESLKRIRIGREPGVDWRMHGATGHYARVEAPQQADGQEAFDVHPGQRPSAPAEPMPIYVSYAWGGESEALVDSIEQRLVCSDIDFVRDKRKLRPGDWISSFMTEIGRAERVLVVLSDKYLRSPFCMRELLHLYQSSLGERQDLMRRVVPLVVGDLAIDRAVQRVAYVKHWQAEDQALTEAYAGLDLLILGSNDRAEWLAIKDFSHHVSDMMAWCADVLMPRGAGGIDAVCKLLQEPGRRV
jgi:internalin A